MSDDLQEECHSAVLHDNIKISCLMVHAKHVEKASLGGRIEMLRGQGLIKVVLLRVYVKFKTNLSSKRVSPTKFLINSPRLVIIGWLTVGPKRKEVVIHQVGNLFVPSVVRSM